MKTSWIARITAATAAFLVFSLAGVCSAQAMIFPELLKLVRVEKPASHELFKENKTEEKAGQKVQAEAYIVEAGDTLWEIGRRYHVDYQEIAEANHIGKDCIIHVGQKLDIPGEAKTIHVVRPGDSLWEIARRYGTSVDKLASDNNITEPKRLAVGKRLVVSSSENVPVLANSYQETPSRGTGLWKWPVIGPITQRYGQRGENFHHGLDIAASVGTKIFPLRPGKVEFSGWLNGIYGKAVILDHGNGLKTLYAHNSQNLVEKGDYVDSAMAIAKIGNTGRTTGPHLHLEVHVDDKTVDPQQYLGSRPGSKN